VKRRKVVLTQPMFWLLVVSILLIVWVVSELGSWR
jgi:hypothetical protein